MAGKHPGTPIREAAEASNPIIPVGSRSDSKRTLKGCFDELDLLLEFKSLMLHCPKGVYIVPSAKSLREWKGVIFVSSGPFKNGAFRFTLYIPDEYPKARPLVRFQSSVCHPLIHSNGVLNLCRISWSPSHHLWSIVEYIFKCFHSTEMWEGCDKAFADKALKCVEESLLCLSLPEDEYSLLKLVPLSDQDYKEAKSSLLKGKMLEPNTPPGHDGCKKFSERL